MYNGNSSGASQKTPDDLVSVQASNSNVVGGASEDGWVGKVNNHNGLQMV